MTLLCHLKKNVGVSLKQKKPHHRFYFRNKLYRFLPSQTNPLLNVLACNVKQNRQGENHIQFMNMFHFEKFIKDFDNFFNQFSTMVDYNSVGFESTLHFYEHCLNWCQNIFHTMKLNIGSMELVHCYLQRIKKFPDPTKYKNYLGAMLLISDKILNDYPYNNFTWAHWIQYFHKPTPLAMLDVHERLELINQAEREMVFLLNFHVSF